MERFSKEYLAKKEKSWEFSLETVQRSLKESHDSSIRWYARQDSNLRPFDS